MRGYDWSYQGVLCAAATSRRATPATLVSKAMLSTSNKNETNAIQRGALKRLSRIARPDSYSCLDNSPASRRYLSPAISAVMGPVYRTGLSARSRWSTRRIERHSVTTPFMSSSKPGLLSRFKTVPNPNSIKKARPTTYRPVEGTVATRSSRIACTASAARRLFMTDGTRPGGRRNSRLFFATNDAAPISPDCRRSSNLFSSSVREGCSCFMSANKYLDSERVQP